MKNALLRKLTAGVVASITTLTFGLQPLTALGYSESDAWYDFSASFNQIDTFQVPSIPSLGSTPVLGDVNALYYTPYSTSNAVTVSNVVISNPTFNPSTQTPVTISFSLNGYATYLNVVAKDANGNVQATIYSQYQPQTGYRSVSWNGAGLQNGTYAIEVQATDAYGQNAYASAQILLVPSNNTYITNTSVSALPTTFGNGQVTTVSYNTNTTVLATIEVRPFGAALTSTPVRTYQETVNAGTHTWNWNGTNDNGQQVLAGDYNITVNLYNTYDAVSTPIKVTFTNGYVSPVYPTYPTYPSYPNCGNGYYTGCPTGTLVLNATAKPSTFNPLNSQLQVSYYVLGQANVTVAIYNDYSCTTNVYNNCYSNGYPTVMNVIRTLKSGSYESGNNTVFWNGRDNNGNIVPNGTYRFRVTATNNGQTDTKDGTFTINAGANAGNLCAGFKDVQADSIYCNALVEMQKQGIFSGYSDGSFRPYQSINRAETVKVIMKALKYNVPLTGWYFDSAGFKDVYSGAWYTPYLAAARLYGVISGYADKTFKPSNTINRAELSKIFLEASGIAAQNVPCYSQPYTDKTQATWFAKYACATKYYSLVDDMDGKFEGAKEMTRGDVALMIYRAQVQGLLKNLPPKAQINFYAIQQYQFPYKGF